MNALTIADRTIRMDEAGRFSLNDLHRAGGGANKHRPSLWLSNRQTKDLIAELDAEAGIPALAVQRGGSRAGTYAGRETALAYSAWVSPTFHVRVLRAADAVLTGQIQQAPDMNATLRDPQTLRALLSEQVDERLRLEHQVAEQAPCAAAFNRLAGARGVVSITAAAKALHLPPTALFAWLKDSGWIYRSGDHGGWLAYQRRMDSGHMRHRSVTVERSDGTPRLVEQPVVTAKGLARLAELLERELDQQQAPRNDDTPSPDRSSPR